MCIVTAAAPRRGTGTTTTLVQLAAALARTGRTVRLLDLDPRRDAAAALGVPRNHPRWAWTVAERLHVQTDVAPTGPPADFTLIDTEAPDATADLILWCVEPVRERIESDRCHVEALRRHAPDARIQPVLLRTDPEAANTSRLRTWCVNHLPPLPTPVAIPFDPELQAAIDRGVTIFEPHWRRPVSPAAEAFSTLARLVLAPDRTTILNELDLVLAPSSLDDPGARLLPPLTRRDARRRAG